MRNLGGLREFEEEYNKPRKALSLTPGEVRKLERQQFPTSSHSSRLEDMSDEQVSQASEAARKWLFTILDYHGRSMERDQEMRMFRLAVEKEMEDRTGDWTDLEQLYMSLSSLELTSPEDRLKAGFMVVLHGNLSERLRDVSEAAAILTERLQYESNMGAETTAMLNRIAQRTESIKVDHFACAVPLSLLTTIAHNTSVVDDNAGCCPICQNSYTDLSEFTVEELLADYPVRIKYCDHIIGKACLEQWMVTPKIDEAKYPYRTCPLCRVDIEGIETPEALEVLRTHLLSQRRGGECLRRLVYDYGVQVEESVEAVAACISEEIACKELLAEVRRQGGNEMQERALKARLEQLNKEKWMWGFKGDGSWKQVSEAWMNSTDS